MVEPTGVEARIETMIPAAEQMTDITAEQRITERKLLKSRIADSAGKIISAEIKSDPTRFIARTITDAVMTAIRRLYRPARIPVACEKVSSKVTEKIL